MKRELAAILAGLRFYQRNAEGKSLVEVMDSIEDIATDGGTFESLTVAEIDTLCEALNFGDIEIRRKE